VPAIFDEQIAGVFFGSVANADELIW